MLLSRFDPPANLTDFATIPNQLEAWSEFVSAVFDSAIEGVEQSVGAGKSQFYNPTKIDTVDPFASKTISWNGFPQLLIAKFPGKRQAWQAADQLPASGERPQDEYLEWHVERFDNNKIKRITFTCEGPEYWEALAAGYPNRYDGPRTAGATGDQQKLLDLYRQYINPAVQLGDLLQNGRYNPYNEWNTRRGAMHLNQRNNTLGAEITIAADATVLRQRNGKILTDATDLIECARYGAAGRASDPRIGADVNELARLGYSITLANPVGLYIEKLDSTGFRTPQGKPPAESYWKVLRGKPPVRAVFEVPAADNFTVSDIKIGGLPIEFGGQVAEHITVKLTGVACRQGQSHNAAIGCQGSAVGAMAAALKKPSLAAMYSRVPN